MLNTSFWFPKQARLFLHFLLECSRCIALLSSQAFSRSETLYFSPRLFTHDAVVMMLMSFARICGKVG